jgi:hypothetical protein
LEKYTFRDPSGQYILCWDLGRFMNHSCVPSCLGLEADFEVAVRDIQPGEELTDDYGTLHLLAHEDFDCRCGAAGCRGRVGAGDRVAQAAAWEALWGSALALLGQVPQPLGPVLENRVGNHPLTGPDSNRPHRSLVRHSGSLNGRCSSARFFTSGAGRPTCVSSRATGGNSPGEDELVTRTTFTMVPNITSLRRVYDDSPAGMTCLGELAPTEQALLQRALDNGRSRLAGAWAARAAKDEIFWINFWQRSDDKPPLEIDDATELDRWARELVAQAYAGEDVEVDGYGFIINPVNAKAQPWHVDYTMDYSEIFIPLSKLTTQNCMQYAVLSPDLPRAARDAFAADLDVIDLDALVEAGGYVSVRQLLARPFSIIKMDFGTIHRGVGNTGDFERIVFWISVNRSREGLPVEPVVEASVFSYRKT